jgi:hypothetical protein
MLQDWHRMDIHNKLTPFNWTAILILLGIALALVEWGTHTFGTTTGPWPSDATQVWVPFAQDVLAGARPYVDVWDNKPPLWTYLSIAAEGTGYWYLTVLCAQGLGAGVGASIVYKYLSFYETEWIAKAGSFLLITASPLAHFYWIDPRTIALPFVLAAVLVYYDRPIVSGALLGIGTLWIQFSIFAAPLVLIRCWVESELRPKFILKAGFAGAATLTIGYSTLMFWGIETAVTGVRTTLFAAGSYSTDKISSSLLSQPVRWLASTVAHTVPLAIFLGPAAYGLFKSSKKWNTVNLPTIAAATFSIQLLIRPGADFLVLIIPWIAIISAVGISMNVNPDS